MFQTGFSYELMNRLPYVLASIVIAFVTLALVSSAASATALVWTDKANYVSGDTVLVSGSGLPVNAKIVVDVIRPNGLDWLVTWTDAQGSFTLSYLISSSISEKGSFIIRVISPSIRKVHAAITINVGLGSSAREYFAS